MSSKGVILTIDRNRRNLELLSQFLRREGYQTQAVSELGDVSALLDDGSPTISLALVDISGFDTSIWQVCEQIREAGIPLLVLSPRQSASIQQESKAHGAQGMLVKPLVPRELMTILASMITVE